MARLNITADNHYTLKLVYKDAEGFPIDITGASAKFVLRRSMYSPIVVNRAADIVGNTGEISVTLVPADTASLLDDVIEEQFVYGVELTLADGTRRVILNGEAILEQNIARD